MNTKQKRELYRKTISGISDNHLSETFRRLKELALISASEAEITEIDLEEDIYGQMIRYFILDAPDPRRDILQDTIRKKLYRLADNLFIRSLSAQPHDHWYVQRKRYHKGEFFKEQDLTELESLIADADSISLDSTEERLEKLFVSIWMSSDLTDNQVSALKQYLNSEGSDLTLGTVIITALILHTLEKFSPDVWMLLADIYESKTRHLWQRALMGMVLTIIRFDHRLNLYPEIEGRLQLLSSDERFIGHLEKVAIQLVRTGDTEKVTRRIQEEIIPEMMKLAPKIQDKLSLDQMIKDEGGEEKNPDWEEFFEESPEIFEKMEELNKLQSEGVDLFITTFSRLKHFPFFHHTVNWFLPFSHRHPGLIPSDTDDSQAEVLRRFFEVFERFPVMCNSDKYSFSLNLVTMSEEQKQMIIGALSGEIGEMIKLTESDDLLSSSAGTEVFHQFAQDLYRFFRVHPANQETEDPFSMRKQLYQCRVTENLFAQFPVLARRLGEYYFHHEHYDHAINLFSLTENEPQDNPELFQKLAYAWQMSGDLNKALDYYKKAELFDSNALWNLKKIAWCYHLQNNLDEAIRTYREAERLAPDSVQIKLNIGNLLLQKGDWDEALLCYLDAEAISPDNEKTLRPVAWCLFLKGELESSASYYGQIMGKAFNHNDLLNFGHVKFALREKSEAFKLYRQSLVHRKNSKDSFIDAYNSDRTHLKRLGLTTHDIAYMLDAVAGYPDLTI